MLETLETEQIKNTYNTKTQFTTHNSLERNNSQSSRRDNYEEMNLWNLEHLNDELLRHQQSIDVEEDNIKNLQKEIHDTLKQVQEYKDETNRKEEDMKQLHSKIECAKRLEEKGQLKVRQQEAQIKMLERVRELKKETRYCIFTKKNQNAKNE